MRVVIANDAATVASLAAERFETLLRERPDAVIGLATGETPLPLYHELVERHRAGALILAKVTTFNLDEYLGIDAGNPQSYRSFMRRHLFEPVGLDAERTHFPDCASGDDPTEAGERFERAIRAAGGIDLQLLGIGRNGHIGFNEPTSSLGSRTRVKTLTKETVEANSRLFSPGESQPVLAMTMGIATILDAREVLLLATGEDKAAAVAAMVEGPLTAMVPASALQLHRQATVIVDEPAASALTQLDYYRWVQAQTEALAAQRG